MSDPKLDVAFEPMIAVMAGAPPVSSLTPQEARTLWADADMGEAEAVWRVNDMEVPGAAGSIAAPPWSSVSSRSVAMSCATPLSALLWARGRPARGGSDRATGREPGRTGAVRADFRDVVCLAAPAR